MTDSTMTATKSMRTHGRTKYVGEVMTNYDYSIDQDVARKLVDFGAVAGYSAWNFHAEVWIEDEHFHALVRQYREHVATYSATSLEALMDAVSKDWGYD